MYTFSKYFVSVDLQNIKINSRKEEELSVRDL